MGLPATERPPKGFKELDWQKEQFRRAKATKSAKDVFECNTKKQAASGPKTIVLPYYPPGSDRVSRYVEVSLQPDKGAITSAQMRVKRAKPIIPGWLIEMSEKYLLGVMDIKSILEDKYDDVYIDDLVSALYNIIHEDMGLKVSESEIMRVMKRIPKTCDGWYSFPHFMFAIGNMQMAVAKGLVMQKERTFPPRDMEEEEEQQKGLSRSRPKKAPLNKSGGDQEYDEEEEEEEGEKAGNNDLEEEDEEEGGGQKPTKEEVDETGYSMREKVFFSGLLIFEMYDTLKKVECLYNLSKIPETDKFEAKKNAQRGYGVDTIGQKKFKETPWDKPPPPIPKISPYLSPIPFVMTRWNTTQPKDPKLRLKRTTSRRQSLHLTIRPPISDEHVVCITENQTRVRRALAFLAQQGDCVAMLPDVHFVIHLSDIAANKLEVITTTDEELQPGQAYDQYMRNRYRDYYFIMDSVKMLYRPYRLPPPISKLSNLISFTDGLQLRAICSHLERQHWCCLSKVMLDFREMVWSRMHVEEIPPGTLRDSFIYAFVTYLPYVPHLPTVCKYKTPI